MQTISGLARVLRVYVDDALQASNDTNKNGLFSARMEFIYKHETPSGNEGDTDAMEFLAEVKGGSVYNVLLNLNRAKVDKGTDLLAYAKQKLEGKEIVMTTFVASIEELTKGDAKAVHRVDNPAKVYSSLNNSYIGVYTDKDGVFTTLQNRLRSAIIDNDLALGEPKIEDEAETKSKTKLNF